MIQHLSSQQNYLRERGSQEDSKVSFVELFFDLVFVFAITQLSHSLLANFTWDGAFHIGFMLLAVWWVWIFTSWVTNWANPERMAVRIMLFALMLAGLVVSTSIPTAFEERGLSFALAYVFMQVGRSLFMCWALYRHDKSNFLNFVRITTWLIVSGVFWITGGIMEGSERIILWSIALLIEYCGPAAFFRTPFIGRSTEKDWDISAEHFSERCALFVIIALGEVLLVSGQTFAGMDLSPVNMMAFASVILGSIGMWWVYFNVGMEHAAHKFIESHNVAKLARLAYTYLHIIIVAGIILTAVADELVLAHPLGHTEAKHLLAILGGPVLFIFGNLVFKRVMFGKFAKSHVAGIMLLIGLSVLQPYCPPLFFGAASSLILLYVAAWETIAVNGKRRK